METERCYISGAMVFRKAADSDVPAIMAILKMAVRQMLAEGKQQWNENYPNEIHVRADIDKGVGYVLEKDKEIVAYAAVVFDGEPAYNSLDGKWLSDEKYVVVHRMAVSQTMKSKGLGRVFMETIEEYARTLGVKSFRIDTNFDNYAMLALLTKLGFTYCGEIQYESGSRKAFEKLII